MKREVRGGGEGGANKITNSDDAMLAGVGIDCRGREITAAVGITKLIAAVTALGLSWQQDMEQLIIEPWPDPEWEHFIGDDSWGDLAPNPAPEVL